MKTKKPSVLGTEVVFEAENLETVMAAWAARHPNHELTEPKTLIRFRVHRKPGTTYLAPQRSR